MSVVPEVRPETLTASPSSWRWVHIGIAALAMVATLPGRTHGLGLVTEPLLNDLHLDRVSYGTINLWATLFGAVFCLPCGWLIDRLGTRTVLTGVLVALGLVVVVMSQVQGDWIVVLPLFGPMMFDLFLLVLLTRGFGQSALSVVSLALMGQASGRRPGFAVGVYSFLVAIGFMAAFTGVGYAMRDRDMPLRAASAVADMFSPQGPFLGAATWINGFKELQADWRAVWAGIGFALFGAAVLSLLLVRPGVSGWTTTEPQVSVTPQVGLTLGEALGTPAFWVFGLATSFYGMIAAGISLFNQSILAERGFEKTVFYLITAISPMIGLAANLVTGWLATRWSLGRLLAMAMLLLTVAMLAFPFVETLLHVYCYAVALGIAGGMITVLFFAVWGQAFGPAHLGKIQGAAQMMTVFASAAGPLLLALSKQQYDSYVPLFQSAAGVAVLLALVAWWTPLPNPTRPRWARQSEAADLSIREPIHRQHSH